MRTLRKPNHFIGAFVASAATWSSFALAQQDPASTVPVAASQGTKGIEEIVVTAQKRSENIKDIPISISAIGGEDLQTRHIADYEDLSRSVPGLNFNSLGGSEGLDNISIRGISSTSGSATVGIYLDDVSITVKNFFDGSSQPKLFDLDRIEVLRGPQGTLYGASSEGGTIRFVTNQPDLNNFSSEVSTNLSGTDHGGLNYDHGFVINQPIEPGRAAVRASVAYSLDSGYVDHFTQSGDLDKSGVNDDRNLTIRLNGKYIASDDTTITPALFYQRDKTDDNGAFYPALGLWKQDKQVVEYGRDTMFLPSLTVNHDLGFADLTSVTGWFYREFARQQDGTFYNSTLFAEAFLDPLYPQQQAQNDSIIGNLRSPVKYTTRYSQISQELRLTSHLPEEGDIPIKWVAGLYYADQQIHNTNYQQIPGINAAFSKIYGFPLEDSLVNTTYGGPGVTQLFPNDVDEADQKQYDERQASVFGQINYDILSDLHAAIGLRYLEARDVGNFNTYGFYQIGNITPFNQLSHGYALTPKYSLTYDIDPQTNVYASASKGFRLGGPEPSPAPFGPTTVCAADFANLGITSDPVKFASDKLWTYELGSKNRLDDNQITLNVAGYYTSWKNIQQQLYLPTCGYYFTANVGDAEIYGGELEANYRPRQIPGLQLGFNASYQHAAISSTDNAATVQVGQRLVDVPYDTYSGSAQYTFPINDGMAVKTRADYTLTGRSNGSYQIGNSNYYNPSYGTLNASVALEADRFTLSLYAKNLTNDHTIIQRPEINTVVEGYTVRPLTLGLTAVYRFGP